MSLTPAQKEKMKALLGHSICDCADKVIDSVAKLQPRQLHNLCVSSGLKPFPGKTLAANGATYTFMIRDLVTRPITKDDPATRADVVEFFDFPDFPDMQRDSLVVALNKLSKHWAKTIAEIVKDALAAPQAS